MLNRNRSVEHLFAAAAKAFPRLDEQERADLSKMVANFAVPEARNPHNTMALLQKELDSVDITDPGQSELHLKLKRIQAQGDRMFRLLSQILYDVRDVWPLEYRVEEDTIEEKVRAVQEYKNLRSK